MQEPATLQSTGFRVGVTGHRLLQDEESVSAAIHESLNVILRAHGRVVAYSALAIGADSLFAESALALGISLCAVVPFTRYEDDFETETSLATYHRLLGSATTTIRLPFEDRSDEAYQAAGRWIVEQCQLLVAVWDGSRTTDMGGSADVISFAERIGRQIQTIPAKRAVAGAQ